MKLAKILKSVLKQEDKNTVNVENLSFMAVSWYIHDKDIQALLDEMAKNDAFNKNGSSTRIPCFIKPEKDNENDKNAMLVTVKCPNGKKWYTVGYVPKDLCLQVKEANKLVIEKSHYWHCLLTTSPTSGTKFSIKLKESLYK